MSRRAEAADRPAHRIAVEVVVLRAGSAAGAGGLAYRRQVAALAPGGDPDRAAAARVGGDIAVLHSTSWRRDPAWGLLLTYVALPDPRAADTPAVPLAPVGIAVGPDPLRPTPAAVTADQVAAHAVRHLALLRHTDPVVAAALGAHPALAAAIAAADPAPAGRIG